ncbi:AAA family ATPase [Tepidibacter thalassicus]|uniref:DNA repair protein RecN n=1 Tax=Tepidibacter thalassicus DSM 15285 TaxID=1123350 RepID=A0A1M5TLJ3_9FIRM|nr:AAA family ATPase [Tepidibacter thalassicus]SHH51627.1 AAA domain [Tepidibacter thalassicus DSM 15285]
MKYIKEINIKNFQSHKETNLKFVNGLNTIIGESDKGKSAIIRAIRWVILNEPQGNGMVRQGTNECSVTITLNDNTKITRIKKLSGKKKITSKNIYIIQYPDGSVSENENFGVDSLQEVLNACGMKILKIDKDLTEIPNFLFQLEAPFLISSNGSARSKTIGKLINANLFDSAIRDIKNDILDIGRKLKEKSNEYETLNEQLKKYDDIEEEEKKLNEIEKLINLYENTEKNIENLKKYIYSFNHIKNEKLKCKNTIDSLINIEKIELYMKNLELKYRESRDLNRININLNNIFENKRELKNAIDKLKNIYEVENIYKNLNNNIDILDKILNLKNKIDNLNRQKILLNKTIDNLKNIDNTSNLYVELENTNKKIDVLTKLNKEINLINREKNKLKKHITSLPDFNVLNELYNKYIDIKSKIEKLNEINKNYKDTTERISKGKNYIEKVNNELKSHIKDYSQMLKNMGKCPTCFADIDNKTVENIISNL